MDRALRVIRAESQGPLQTHQSEPLGPSYSRTFPPVQDAALGHVAAHPPSLASVHELYCSFGNLPQSLVPRAPWPDSRQPQLYENNDHLLVPCPTKKSAQFTAPER